MQYRDNIINDLCVNLQPVKRVKNIELIAIGWTMASAFFVVLTINYFGLIRPTAIENLLTSPRFLLETLLGLIAIVCLSILGFRDAVPGRWSKEFMVVAVIFMVLWIGQYIIGLVFPTIEKSTFDKRDFCYLEAILYSIPPMLGAYYLVSKLYPVDIKRSVTYISLASGMMPALYMQFACIYDAPHILVFHILPGLLMVAVGLIFIKLLAIFKDK